MEVIPLESERQSGKRFFSSLGFLVAVLVTVFAALFYFAPSYKQDPAAVTDSKRLADTAAKDRRVKMRQKSVAAESATHTPAEPAAHSAVPAAGAETGAVATASDAAGDSAEKLTRAIDLIDTGNPRDAQAILEDILRKDPKNEQALVELGMIHLIDYHAPSAALPYLEDALRVNGKNKVVLSELVGVYEELGQGDQGLAFLTDLQASQPTNGPLNLGIGQVLAGQGRDAEAIPYLEAAAESGDPDSDYALEDLADAYASAGNSEKALSTYKRAIDREKLRIQSLPDSGDSSSHEGNDERLNSLDLGRARLLLSTGQFDEAETVLKALNGRMPNDEAVISLMDQLDHKRGAG
jgi:predicted Zn-dependent protease